MTSPRTKLLETGIASEIAPFLMKAGFAFDRKKRGFGKCKGACTQIVNFQVGTRSMEGLFAVNLGIYHPVYREDPDGQAPKFPEDSHCLVRERLSTLRETTITKLFRPRLGRIDNPLKWWLTTPSDAWWQYSEVQGETIASLASVKELLQAKGLPWLEIECNEDKLRKVYEERRRTIGEI